VSPSLIRIKELPQTMERIQKIAQLMNLLFMRKFLGKDASFSHKSG